MKKRFTSLSLFVDCVPAVAEMQIWHLSQSLLELGHGLAKQLGEPVMIGFFPSAIMHRCEDTEVPKEMSDPKIDLSSTSIQLRFSPRSSQDISDPEGHIIATKMKRTCITLKHSLGLKNASFWFDDGQDQLSLVGLKGATTGQTLKVTFAADILRTKTEEVTVDQTIRQIMGGEEGIFIVTDGARTRDGMMVLDGLTTALPERLGGPANEPIQWYAVARLSMAAGGFRRHRLYPAKVELKTEEAAQ